MTDNERIRLLQESVVKDMNASSLPLGVKSLVLENALLKIVIAMHSESVNSDKDSDSSQNK